jgi:uncharacterized protein (TIGR03083 family)
MAALLREVESHLLTLLAQLPPAAWTQPTVVPGWTVHHVAAHLLDGALRKVALLRDGHAVATPRPGEPLPDFIHRLNAEGVAAFSRLSPPQLIAHLRLASHDFCAFHEALDPAAPAAFPVSWAGEDSSTNAFDTARELTERWHHQQQIRLATGHPGLDDPAIHLPVLDTFLHALPHRYRDIDAPPGAALEIRIAGAAWSLTRHHRWTLQRGSAPRPAATVTIPAQLAWRLFTNSFPAGAQLEIDGDPALAAPLYSTRAIVA